MAKIIALIALFACLAVAFAAPADKKETLETANSFGLGYGLGYGGLGYGGYGGLGYGGFGGLGYGGLGYGGLGYGGLGYGGFYGR